MTRTHELPADAFRRDRAHERTPMLHDIDRAPVTDHQAIEQRLSRLERQVSAMDTEALVAEVLSRIAAAMRDRIERVQP